MATSYTPNYKLDLYTDTDKPNLRDQYNGAMNKIDSQFTTVSNNIVVAIEAANQAKEKADSASDSAATNAQSITTLNNTVSGIDTAYKAADSSIIEAYKAADSALANTVSGIDTAYKEADSKIETAYKAADAKLSSDITSAYKSADSEIETAYKAADTALGARIDTLESISFNDDVVLLGDSYGEGYNPDGNVTSWIEMATTALNRRGVNVYSRYLGGIGIVNEYNGVNFATLLDQLGNSLTDAQKKKVGTVYIGGGWNDGYNPSVSDFRTGINAIEKYAYSHFSNAKIVYDWFGFGNWLVSSSVANKSLSITSSIGRAFEAVMTSNFKNVSLLDSTYLLRKASYFASDGIHPTLSGQQKLANHVIDVLAGVFDVDAKRYGSVSDISIDGITNGSISQNTAAIVKNGAFVFNQTNAFVKGQIILSTAIPVSFTGLVFTMYSTNPNALVFGTEPFDIPITICAELQNSNAGTEGNFINVSGFLHFHVNADNHRLDIDFYAKNAKPDGRDFLRGDLKQIQFAA